MFKSIDSRENSTENFITLKSIINLRDQKKNFKRRENKNLLENVAIRKIMLKYEKYAKKGTKSIQKNIVNI